jgi:hypothetical protein
MIIACNDWFIKVFSEELINKYRTHREKDFDVNEFYTDLAKKAYDNGLAIQTKEDGYCFIVSNIQTIRDQLIKLFTELMDELNSWQAIA